MNYGYSDEQENFGMGGFFSDLVNTANTSLTKVLTKSTTISNAILSADAKLKTLKGKIKPLLRRPPATPSAKPAGPTDKPLPTIEPAIITGTLPAVPKSGPEALAEKFTKYSPYIAAIAGGLILINLLTPKYRTNPCHRRRR